MSKKCIAIEYNGSSCNLVQVRRTSSGVYAEKAAIISKDKYGCFSDEMQQAGFNKKLPIVITVSPDKCHYMNIESDQDITSSPDDTSKNSPAVKMADSVQIHLPEIHKLASSGPSSLLISVEKDGIENIKELCKANDLSCSRIELPVFAMMAAYKNHGSESGWMQLYVTNSRITIAVLSNENLLLVRNVPLPGKVDISSIVAQELQLSWRTAFGIHIPEDTKVVVINNHTEYPELDSFIRSNLRCQVQPVIQVKETEYDKSIESPEQFVIPLAAANIYFKPNEYIGMNLVKTIKEESGGAQNTSKYRITTVLLVLVMFAYIFNLVLNNYKLNKIHNQVNSDIISLFNNSVPGQNDKKLVPKMMLSIMKEKEGSISKTYERLTEIDGKKYDWLLMLNNIAKAKPGVMTIDNISFEGHSIKIAVIAEKDVTESFKKSILDLSGNIGIEIVTTSSNNALVTINMEKQYE